jgi:molybdopterin/thiamine biosynthesis adenylyltransferase
LSYLAAAGVGRLGIIDDDVVDISNLQRQIIFKTTDVGERKVSAAARAVAALNPHVNVETHHARLGPDNAADLIGSFDLVADGSDNFATRYLLADACEQARRPLVTAALGRFDGSLTTLAPYETDPHGGLNPRLRDIFPSPPPAGAIPTCAGAGVLGAVAGIIGTLQATEILKVLLKIGTPLIGTLLLVDALSFRFETISYSRS